MLDNLNLRPHLRFYGPDITKKFCTISSDIYIYMIWCDFLHDVDFLQVKYIIKDTI